MAHSEERIGRLEDLYESLEGRVKGTEDDYKMLGSQMSKGFNRIEQLFSSSSKPSKCSDKPKKKKEDSSSKKKKQVSSSSSDTEEEEPQPKKKSKSSPKKKKEEISSDSEAEDDNKPKKRGAKTVWMRDVPVTFDTKDGLITVDIDYHTVDKFWNLGTRQMNCIMKVKLPEIEKGKRILSSTKLCKNCTTAIVRKSEDPKGRTSAPECKKY